MPQTMPQPDPRTQPNSLRSRIDKIRGRSVAARIDPNLTEQKEILAVIRQTKSELSLSGKAMALAAGCTESEFSDALNGKDNRRFDAQWLWRQDDAFLIKFLDNLMDARHLTPENVSAIRRKRIVELVELLLSECA